MNLEILNQQVLNIEEITTPNQTAIVKTHYCMLRKITMFADRASINIGDVSNIKFQWQTFSLEQDEYTDDTNSQPFIANIAGEAQEIESIEGSAIIQFFSQVTGQFEIRTVNPDADNASIEVVVADAAG